MYSNKPYSVASFESKSKQCVRSMIFLKRQEANGQKLMKIEDNQRKLDIVQESKDYWLLSTKWHWILKLLDYPDGK